MEYIILCTGFQIYYVLSLFSLPLSPQGVLHGLTVLRMKVEHELREEINTSLSSQSFKGCLKHVRVVVLHFPNVALPLEVIACIMSYYYGHTNICTHAFVHNDCN